MLLIADSGSTKTHWCLVNNGGVVKEIFTKGINPFYQSEIDIKYEIEHFLLPELKNFELVGISFYGAGCAFPDKKAIVCNALGACFKDTAIEVYSDLLAAARALFGKSEGIACILGTGSNSCFYDGNVIVDNISPLGFILGDEGSGAVLSRKFVSDCLKNQLSDEIKKTFFEKYELTPADILENVYKKPFPNRYLAAFTPFLRDNIDNSAIYDIVYGGFVDFFKRNVMQYDYKNHKTGIIGSVGFHFKDQLISAADECGVQLGSIDQSPMAGLIKYHIEN